MNYKDVIPALADLMNSGITISPWLAGVNSENRFDPEIFSMIDLEATEYVSTHWINEDRTQYFGTIPIPERLPVTALYEIIASTAVLIAHEKTGEMLVDESIAREAVDLVKRFLESYGLYKLLKIYALCTSFENQHALAYYGSIPEKEFLLGTRHRPWIDYSLSDDLLLGSLAGNYQIVISEGKRFVQLTDRGYAILKNNRKILEDCGYLSHRLRSIRISQFNYFLNYDDLANLIWPDFLSLRREFLSWIDLKPGMKVLEIGCATGTFTFEAGLADLVGPTGQVICVDRSIGMLRRAEKKRQERGIDWVNFIQCKVEELPFLDGEFDAVVGVAFLHFTDQVKAIKEMIRVTRPGGTIASFHPLKAKLNVPFFQEWFSLIIELASQRKEPPKDYLPFPHEIPEKFANLGLSNVLSLSVPVPSMFHDPKSVVDHFILGVGWFQEELADLPWKDREMLIEKLRERGQSVSEKFPKEELVFVIPNQMVKGIRL